MDPPGGQDQFLDTYKSSIINEFLKELDTPLTETKKNLKNRNTIAMSKPYTNTDIVIKPADKGGSIAIMNTTDYTAEAERQLKISWTLWEKLQEDPTQKSNTHINNLLN